MFDAYEFEGGYYAFEVEAHVHEAVDHVLVVAPVSVCAAKSALLCGAIQLN